MTDVKPQMARGEAKNYFWEAVLSTLLFYFGIGVGGLVASVHFLLDVRRTRASDRPVQNVGCLWTTLVVHTLLLLAGIILLISNR